jgi:hypothetical protein
MHLFDDHMRYAIIWFSLAGLLLIAFRLAARPYACPFLMSAFGTFRTEAIKLTRSAHRGKADLATARPQV